MQNHAQYAYAQDQQAAPSNRETLCSVAPDDSCPRAQRRNDVILFLERVIATFETPLSAIISPSEVRAHPIEAAARILAIRQSKNDPVHIRRLDCFEIPEEELRFRQRKMLGWMMGPKARVHRSAPLLDVHRNNTSDLSDIPALELNQLRYLTCFDGILLSRKWHSEHDAISTDTCHVRGAGELPSFPP